MQRFYETRQALIESAVRVVARDGLERTTTRSISVDSGLNEAYIYRAFADKDDLLRAALHLEDARLIFYIVKLLPAMSDTSLSWHDRCYNLFKPVWDFIIEEPDDFVFYVRYYYSANFNRFAAEEHNESFRTLENVMASVFKPDVPVSIILHQVFETMLSYGLRVIEGTLPNTEDSCRLAFEQIYVFIVPNILEDVLNGGEVNMSEVEYSDDAL